jgi:hypothetical protein
VAVEAAGLPAGNQVGADAPAVESFQSFESC